MDEHYLTNEQIEDLQNGESVVIGDLTIRPSTLEDDFKHDLSTAIDRHYNVPMDQIIEDIEVGYDDEYGGLIVVYINHGMRLNSEIIDDLWDGSWVMHSVSTSSVTFRNVE